MQIDKISTINFSAITYKPGCQKYVEECLTQRDISVLESATKKLENFKNWDLEITSRGFLIASKKNADAILVEESNPDYRKPIHSELLYRAIYDGHHEKCQRDKYCEFYLKHANIEEALKSYDMLMGTPLTEKAVLLTEMFEKQEMIFRPKPKFFEAFSKFIDNLF